MSLQSLLKAHKIPCDSSLLERLECYTQTLLTWNRTHNLSGAKTPSEVYRNILDSLYPLGFLPKNLQENFTSCIDIGSGAGFPGIILAGAIPHVHFHLVEPRMKRAGFLHFVALEMGISNLTIHRIRIEELRLNAPSLITSRALTNAPLLLRLCAHILSPSTAILLYKGEQSSEEMSELAGFTLMGSLGARRYFFKQGA